MKTIQTSAGQIELQEIIRALSQLKVPDLEGVTHKLFRVLVEKRKSLGMSGRQEDLVEQIKHGGPTDQQRVRQRTLLTKSVMGSLTEAENEEALRLIPVFEEWDYERMLLLVELAELRGCPVEEVMQQLNIAPAADVVA